MSILEHVRAGSSGTIFHLRARAFEAVVVVALAAVGSTAGVITVRSSADRRLMAASAPIPAFRPMPVAPPIDVPFLQAGPEGVPPSLPCDEPLVLRYDSNGSPYDADAMIAEAASWLAVAARRSIAVENGPTAWNLPPSAGRVELRVMWVPVLANNPDLLGEGGPVIAGGRILAGQVALAATTAWSPTDLAGGELGIVLHESGHALFNLAHSPDPGRQMYATAQRDRPPGFTQEEAQAIAWVADVNCPTGGRRA